MSIFALPMLVAAAAEPADPVEVESSGLPQLDPTWFPSQIFWLAVTFGVLYWLMSTRILPALGGAIEERRDRIADDLDQASEFRRQAEDAEAAYNRALADARAKAQAIAADTRAEVDADIATMQGETDAALEGELEAAEARIAEMKAEASTKVREAASETARAIVEALIDEAPTKDAVDRALGAASAARAA